VIPKLLDWEDPGAAFTAVIQWGTLVAAMIYFRQDIIRLTRAMLSGISTRKWVATLDAKMSWMIVVGTIPVVVFGVLLHKYIEGPFRSLYVIAASAIVLALALAAAEGVARWRLRADLKLKGMDDLSWWDAVAVGFAQAVAIIPGASRSGVTITGGLFVGMKRETAARFSFLLSLPAVFGAGLFELYKRRHELLKSQESIINLIAATVVAGIVGYATIAFLLNYLKRHSTYLFIIYRLLLGVILLVLMSTKVLEDDVAGNHHSSSAPIMALRGGRAETTRTALGVSLSPIDRALGSGSAPTVPGPAAAGLGFAPSLATMRPDPHNATQPDFQ
jgi:undecaprenyl-diphosphatase